MMDIYVTPTKTWSAILILIPINKIISHIRISRLTLISRYPREVCTIRFKHYKITIFVLIGRIYYSFFVKQGCLTYVII